MAELLGQRLQVVLVPRDDRAVRHARGLLRNHVVQRLSRDHEPAHVDGEVTRRAHQLGRQSDDPVRQRTADRRVDPVLGIGERPAQVVAVPAIQPARELLRLLRRQPHDLGHIAHRALVPEAVDLRHHGRALAPVLLVDVLDHALAVLVRDVQIDVGQLAALG